VPNVGVSNLADVTRAILKSSHLLQLSSIAPMRTVARNSPQRPYSTITAGTSTVMVGDSSLARAIRIILNLSLQFRQHSLAPSVRRSTHHLIRLGTIAEPSTATVRTVPSRFAFDVKLKSS